MCNEAATVRVSARQVEVHQQVIWCPAWVPCAGRPSSLYLAPESLTSHSLALMALFAGWVVPMTCASNRSASLGRNSCLLYLLKSLLGSPSHNHPKLTRSNEVGVGLCGPARPYVGMSGLLPPRQRSLRQTACKCSVPNNFSGTLY